MPLVILFLCYKYPFINKLGPVILAYLFGLILGNSGILPSMGSYLNDFLITNPKAGINDIELLLGQKLLTENDLLAFRIYKLKDTLTSITILLAIPLMLFSANIRDWGQLAGKTFVSMIIGLFSVVTMIVLGFFIFRESGINDLWKLSGLLVGVYTGGTPNLASLKLMLDVDAETYILTHTYDLIVGVFYLSFLLTIGKKIFLRFLPAFPASLIENKIIETDQKESFWIPFHAKYFKPLLKSFGVALVILLLAGGLAILVPESLLMVVIILTITTLAILASLIPAINRIRFTFESGMYLILIFSLVVASMADVRNFAGLTPGLLGYISLAVFGSLGLHFLLSKLFKVDAHTTMITSVAFICSPPFVPVIAGALGNKQIVVSGISVGIIGYALGNYLGFLIANLLRMM
jgi:uncharacterized membrane protein